MSNWQKATKLNKVGDLYSVFQLCLHMKSRAHVYAQVLEDNQNAQIAEREVTYTNGQVFICGVNISGCSIWALEALALYLVTVDVEVSVEMASWSDLL